MAIKFGVEPRAPGSRPRTPERDPRASVGSLDDFTRLRVESFQAHDRCEIRPVLHRAVRWPARGSERTKLERDRTLGQGYLNGPDRCPLKEHERRDVRYGPGARDHECLAGLATQRIVVAAVVGAMPRKAAGARLIPAAQIRYGGVVSVVVCLIPREVNLLLATFRAGTHQVDQQRDALHRPTQPQEQRGPKRDYSPDPLVIRHAGLMAARMVTASSGHE